MVDGSKPPVWCLGRAIEWMSGVAQRGHCSKRGRAVSGPWPEETGARGRLGGFRVGSTGARRRSTAEEVARGLEWRRHGPHSGADLLSLLETEAVRGAQVTSRDGLALVQASR